MKGCVLFAHMYAQMDLGVGSVVFSQGLVSAIHIIKNPAYLTAPLIPKLSTAIRKTLPLLILGLLRIVSVKGTEYPVRRFSFTSMSRLVSHESLQGT